MRGHEPKGQLTREQKSTALDYYKEVLELGEKLFPLFALALDLPETFFEDKVGVADKEALQLTHGDP